MSPLDKIHYENASEECIRCKYCNDTHFWKHGSYIRTAFYQKHSPIYATSQSVQRYKCCNSPCKRTFSILPPDVVPYSRFHWKDLLSIAGLLFSGTSVYRIAHTMWGLSKGIISRAKVLLYRLKAWFIRLCHESLQPDNETFKEAAFFCQNEHSWSTFTWMWGFHIYPSCFGTYLTPHKTALK